MNDNVTRENDNARTHIQTHEKIQELTAMVVKLQKLYCELADRVAKIEEIER